MAGNPLATLIGLDEIEAQLRQLRVKVDNIDRKLTTVLGNQALAKEVLMAEREEIANLVQQVQNNKDAGSAAAQAIKGMLERIQAQGQELQEAIAANTDVSPDIKQAADDLKASTEALMQAVPQVAHAIVANTKAA